MLSSLAGQLATIEVRLQGLEAKLLARHKADPRSQLLATIPGVGPIGAVSFSLKSLPSRRRGCQMPRCFVPVVTPACAGQAFAAWLGITPRERSTAGRQRQGPISREGDEGLRRLLVLGATAVIKQAKPGRTSSWLLGLLARKPKKLAAVALANKMARIIWAMMVSGEVYRPPNEA